MMVAVVVRRMVVIKEMMTVRRMVVGITGIKTVEVRKVEVGIIEGTWR